jgi:hypothetical protein
MPPDMIESLAGNPAVFGGLPALQFPGFCRTHLPHSHTRLDPDLIRAPFRLSNSHVRFSYNCFSPTRQR